MTRRPRLAANPIPYWGPRGKTREVFEEAFADFRSIGFTAVKADLLEGMSPTEYLDWIGGFGLAPAVSLFSSPFDDTVDPAALREDARRFAADQAALGLDRAMLSSMAMAERLELPAVGAAFRPDRLDRAIELAAIACEAMIGEGIRPLHHSHVGGVFETEHEITALLDTLGPDVIGIGPDTGHLRWAGIDPAVFIARYADRIGAIHLKDLHGDFLDERRGASGGYLEQSRSGRLWAEPGLGVIDLDAVIAAMPDDYDGDWMIEVDNPSLPTVVRSHEVSFAWAQEHLPVG